MRIPAIRAAQTNVHPVARVGREPAPGGRRDGPPERRALPRQWVGQRMGSGCIARKPWSPRAKPSRRRRPSAPRPMRARAQGSPKPPRVSVCQVAEDDTARSCSREPKRSSTRCAAAIRTFASQCSCNGETDSETHACRARVARALLAAVSATTFGRLVLTASRCASLPLRQELFSLMGALSEQLRGTTATVFSEVHRPVAQRR